MAIAIELVGGLGNARAARLQGAAVNSIAIGHIHVENRRHGPGFGATGIAHHDPRIADFHLGMHHGSVGLGHAMDFFGRESLFYEIN